MLLLLLLTGTSIFLLLSGPSSQKLSLPKQTAPSLGSLSHSTRWLWGYKELPHRYTQLPQNTLICGQGRGVGVMVGGVEGASDVPQRLRQRLPRWRQQQRQQQGRAGASSTVDMAGVESASQAGERMVR